MSALLKSQSVLTVEHVSEIAATYSDRDGREPISRVITISRQVFDDLGKPTTLTLTIEPGDRLNPPAVMEVAA